MHICLDARSISHPRRGGFKTYVENLVPALAEISDQHEFTLIYDRPFKFLPIANNPRFHEMVIPAGLPMAGQAYREQVALPLHRRAHPNTLWHFPYNTAPVLGIRKYVLTLHDVTSFTHAARPDWSRPARALKELALFYYPRVLIRRSAKRAAAIITVSNYARHQIIEHLQVPAQKVFVTPLAASPLFRPLTPSQKHQARRDVKEYYGVQKPFILTVASSLLKNPQGLVRAYAALPPQLRQEYELVVVMAYERFCVHIETLAKRLGVARQLHILLDVAPLRLRLLYSLAAAFVYPSFTESFGLPTIEAMACGTPVICSNTTALPEVVGDAALTLSPHDQSQLSGALVQLLSSAALKIRLREAGLRRAASLSWRATAEHTSRIYAQVAGAAAQTPSAETQPPGGVPGQ